MLVIRRKIYFIIKNISDGRLSDAPPWLEYTCYPFILLDSMVREGAEFPSALLWHIDNFTTEYIILRYSYQYSRIEKEEQGKPLVDSAPGECYTIA